MAGLILFAIWLAATTGGEGPTDVVAGQPAATLAPLSTPEQSTTTLTPTTTTTPATPPRLGDMVPWLNGSLVLIGAGPANSVIVWDDSSRQPQRYPFSGANVLSVRLEPSLDNIAYETAGSSANALYMGGWTTQEPIFVGSQGFAWDPAGTSTLMWVGTDQVTRETSLYSKQVDAPTVRLTAVPTKSRLVAWTEAGLVMREIRGEPVGWIDERQIYVVREPILTVLRSPDGAVITSMTVEPLRASRSGTIVGESTTRAFEVAGVETADASTIDRAGVLIMDPVSEIDEGETTYRVRELAPPETLDHGDSIFDGDWALSPDGNWLGRVVTSGEAATSLVVQSLSSLSVRVVPFPTAEERIAVGFSRDGGRFFTYAPESHQLTIVDWSTAAMFTVTLEDTPLVGGAYVRPAP